MPHGSSATYGSMAHSVVELMVFMENLASGGHHGESCDCPGAASRVVVHEIFVRSTSVHLLEGWADGGSEDVQRRVWWCPVIPGLTVGTKNRKTVPNRGKPRTEPKYTETKKIGSYSVSGSWEPKKPRYFRFFTSVNRKNREN
jgi:hypothetical protein